MKKIQPTESNLKYITTILQNGYTWEHCNYVIAAKAREWIGTPMQKYLRPTTLFNLKNFENYFAELRDIEQNPGTHDTHEENDNE